MNTMVPTGISLGHGSDSTAVNTDFVPEQHQHSRSTADSSFSSSSILLVPLALILLLKIKMYQSHSAESVVFRI